MVPPVSTPETPDASPRPAWPWLRAWPYLVVIVVALLGSALHAAQYTPLSPFDESRHVDYMARLYEDGHIVKLGDKLGDTAMRLEACRGVDVQGFVPPPCATRRFDPVDFRDEGYNNAVNNPPLYYVVTGGVASLVKGVGLSDSILDPARLMGGVWLALGLALAVYAGELLGVRRVPLVAAAVIFALAAEPLLMASTVNADSASVFAGALTLVVALLWQRRRLGVGWLLAVGAVAAAFKMTNLIGVGIVAAWLLTEAYRSHRSRAAGDDADSPAGTDGDDADAGVDPGDADAGDAERTVREYLWATGLVVAGAVGVTVLWLAIAGARATIDALDLPSNRQFYEPGFPFRTFVVRQNVFSLFPPVDGFRAPVLDTPMNQTVGYASDLLASAVLVVALLRYDVRNRIGTLAAWTGALLLVAGPAFILSTWVVNRVIFEPVGRYGLSAIAMIVVATGAAVKGKVGTVLISMFAVLVACTVLGTLAFS